MSERTLFLAWQDQGESRQWFPIGRLDADRALSRYSFRYTGGALRAQEEAYFQALPEFPEMEREYLSPELFYLFQNRVMKPNRPDFREHIKRLGLPEDSNPDPFQILSVSGGQRATDFYEVFPQIVKNADGSFATRFFLHGWRYTTEFAQERLNQLTSEEELYVVLELNNPVTRLAVQLQTQDYHMIGWAPRYLVSDLARAIAGSPCEYEAKVVRINPAPAPMKQRVLIELCGNLGEHEPMIGEDFLPLVDAAG